MSDFKPPPLPVREKKKQTKNENQSTTQNQTDNNSNDSTSIPPNHVIGENGELIKLLYEAPFWSEKPKYNYILEVVKDGSVIEEINIHEKGHYLIGRAPICDIVLDNPTVSRQHAVIQMRKTGECYIYDLGSTHKTFVNKTPVIPRQYAKLKSGDLINFGMSTRLFYLQGGPEEDVKPIHVPNTSSKPIPVSKTEKEESQSNFIQQLLELKREQKEEFSLKGIHDDDEDFDQDEEDYTMLKKTIDALRDDEDDEFFDRTEKQKISKSKTIVDTYETLLSKKDMLEKIRNTLNIECVTLRKTIKEQEELIANKEFEDLDDFMSKNRHSPEEEALKQKQWLIKEIEQELKGISRLIEKVKPPSGTKSLLKLTKSMKEQVLVYLKVFMDKYEQTNIKSNQKKRKYTFNDLLKKSEDTSYEKNDRIENEEEQKEKQDRYSDFKVIKDDGGNYNTTKRMKKTIPDLSEKYEEVPLLNDDEEKKEYIPENLGKVQRKERKKQPIIQYDDENVNYESWAPPPDQTGDGRTSLNDKYGY